MSFTTSTPVSFALTAGRVFAVRTKLNAGGIAKVYGATSNKEYSIPQAFAGTFGPYAEDKTVVVAALSGVIEYDFGATVSLPGYVYNSAISEHSGSAVSQYRAVEFVVSTAAAIPALPYQGDGVFVKDENGATWPWNGSAYGKPLTSSGGAVDALGAAAVQSLMARPWRLESRPEGTPSLSRIEAVTVAAGASLTLVNIQGQGPGYVADVFVAALIQAGLAASTNMTDVNNSMLDFYYDGAGSPAFSIRLCMFFCAEYMGQNLMPGFQSTYMGASNLGGNDATNVAIQHAMSGYNKMAIPFTSGLKIVLRNTSANSILWFSLIQSYAGLADNYFTQCRLMISSGSSSQAVNTVVNLATVAAGTKGRVFGLYQLFDANGSASPASVVLEGNHRVWLDNPAPIIGTTTPTMEWSGTEDYFQHGWYFAMGTTIDPTQFYATQSTYVGLTVRSSLSTGLFAAYRFHVPDPMPFTNGFKFTWNCGDSTQQNFTGNEKTSWALFYYTTP